VSLLALLHTGGARRRLLAPVVAVAVLALGGPAGTYVVRPGETLSAIAGRFGVSVGDLAKANGISDPNRVFAGQTLKLPGTTAAAPAPAPTAPARVHTVAPGETLTGIAARYSASVAGVVQLNAIPDPNHVRIGTKLRIPDAATAPATGLPARLRASPARLALVPHFQRWGVANNLDPAFVMAVAWQESGWQNSVVSPAGAIGIGQLLPSTAKFVSQDLIGVGLDPKIPEHNIRMTARYLRWLLARTDGNVELTLAGYYQGPASVASIGMLPSTVVYIAIVKALQPKFKDI
jgi:soluble lytic murein transglycosylase-like protein